MGEKKSVGWMTAIGLLFWRNWLTRLGASIATVAAFAIIAFIILGILGLQQAPYVGIIAFMILPGVFIAALLLIPLGVWWDRRRRAKGGAEVPEYPTFDFNDPKTRRAFYIVALLTLANIFIVSTVSYKGVVYSESVPFCGQVCHDVMEPEFTAFLNSPHSNVACVECHIGPGAPWFVRSKLSGVRQVFAVMLDTYSKPIATPVENLRPARETCEECHRPERFTGDRVRVITRYAEDEANTPLTTVLLMHIGGGHSNTHGIHSWHIDPNKTTTYYATDKKREEIALVRVTEADGTVTEYRRDGVELPENGPPASEMRTMDCIDCHNRPTHIYRMPGQAMDEAMVHGMIDRDVPYIKQKGVEVLQAVGDAASDDEAEAYIDETLLAYYQENHGEWLSENRAAFDTAVDEIKAIFNRNVFPKMKVTWGTYPDHIGHVEFTGCFRCHDSSLTNDKGESIEQDCTACHQVLALQEENPDILSQLGIQ